MTAAVGLVTTVVGVALAVVAVVDAVTPAPLAGPRPGDTVALALATLALGAPLWGRTWRGLQARVAAGDVDELRSTARRVYVQGVLGLSGVVAAGSAVSILFVIFRDLLEGRLGAASVRDVRVGIGLAVAAGAPRRTTGRCTGASVRTLHRLDVETGAVDADAIADAVAASPHTHLLVTVDGDGTVHAIPVARQ